MKPMDRDLPDELRTLLDGSRAGEEIRGRLGSSLTKITDRDGRPAFLKVGSGAAAADLAREAARLEWIGSRLVVPDVLFFADGDPAFLLISAVAGRPSHEWLDELGAEHVVRALARTLRSIHELPVGDCPFDSVVATEIAEAQRRLHRGEVDERAFIRATGMAPLAALDWLQHDAPLREGPGVFTHGDYYMPNVLIDDGEVSGVVDWGLAGVADPNRDFMSMDVTLRLNLDDSWRATFDDQYGRGTRDGEVVHAYFVLDQFFGDDTAE